jgi:hypothetical protein
MFDALSRFKQHHKAVCSELDGEVALFQSDTCDYLVLNETGSLIWRALESRPTLDELCMQLQQEYDVTPEECTASTQAWLEVALQKKVVVIIPDD